MSNQPEGKNKLESLRREYEGRELVMDQMQPDPVDQFSIWFEEALEAEHTDANAMTLATADRLAQPSARTVLLKGFDKDGFCFYTNYRSRKGQELEENPQAALCFFWPELDRQVRINGEVEKATRKQSEAYFHMRPRNSQLAARASDQSSELESREELREQFEEVKNKFEGGEVPLPDFWGGYILEPVQIEFWQGRPGRLHDRILYKKTAGKWKMTRLSP